MIQNIDYETCKDGKKLETLLLNKHELLDFKELVYLLEPFAKATSLMGGDTYPTVSLMLPIIATLQEHLFKVESILTYLVVCDIKNEIELNIAKFAPEKFNETKISLK
ncbi:4819_t:CDS:2 [Dentiscutata heterogama]|uniref:4819_t:CDS:1 n=1 Tax=Dentiscutata heterogama TaxID=1316150 RepID=A0ACA9LMF1_9GLOM|nr:4819_t:CDS:2 [Dentiscutata heterogama]